jgi:hypothetical protein
VDFLEQVSGRGRIGAANDPVVGRAIIEAIPPGIDDRNEVLDIFQNEAKEPFILEEARDRKRLSGPGETR